MFAQNGKISGRQLNRMLVLDLFAASSMVLPRLLPRVCAGQGIFAIVPAALFALAISAVYMKTAQSYDDNLYAFSKRQAGGAVAAAIVLFFMVKFLLSAVFILKMFSEVISRTFLTEMPERLIAALIIVTALYGVGKGIETRGRICEILCWFVIVPIMAIVFLSAFEMKGSRIFPMTADSPREIFSGSFLCASVFSVTEFLLFSVPCVCPKQCGEGISYDVQSHNGANFRKLYRHVMWAVIAAAVCTAFIYIACIGIFSVPGACAEQWPAVTLMQVIRFPGRFISRQDGLMLAVWMGSVFVLLGGYIFYTGELIRQIFPKKYLKKTMILWLVLVYGLFWVIDDYGAFERFYWKAAAYAGLPISVLIAVGLGVGAHRTKRRVQ